MVKLIPQIAQKISNVLKKLEITPKESPQGFIKRTKKRKHRYSTICFDKKGKKFIFYASLHDSPREKNKMKTEVKFAQFLIKNKKNYSFFPKYFLARIEKNFCWILREFVEEKPLESKKEIEKLERKLSEEEIKKICKVLIEMQKIKVSQLSFLKQKELNNFFKIPEEIKKRKVLVDNEINKIKKFILKNRQLLKAENKYFCHGDFQIGNIILSKDGVKIIDLESAMISNFAFDICFLWLRLWREKVRKKFLEYFYNFLPKEKKKKFEILFRLNCLFLGFHNFCATPTEYLKEMVEKRKLFNLKAIKSAISGFKLLKNL